MFSITCALRIIGKVQGLEDLRSVKVDLDQYNVQVDIPKPEDWYEQELVLMTGRIKHKQWSEQDQHLSKMNMNQELFIFLMDKAVHRSPA